MAADFDWDDLLLELGDGNIIPVIGQDLLTTVVDDQPAPVERWIVQQLLSHFRERGDLDDGDVFRPEMSLNEFTLRYMSQFPIDKRENRKRMVKKVISRLLIDDAIDIPPVMHKLAEIDRFDLFVSLTADTLLDQAIASIRGSSNSLANKLRSAPQDVPLPLTVPTVYHVFGTFDENQDFAVTDEDLVEYLHSFSSEGSPRNLMDHLSDKSLLLIGCGPSRRLLPFLVRTLANDRLFPSKNYRVVDESLNQDQEILLFWRGFSGEVLATESAAEFVDELHRRWQEELGPEQTPSGEQPSAPAAAVSRNPAPTQPEGCHVFVSYRRDDQEAADRIVAALRSRNLTVWYDQTNIQGGDDWMREVEKNVGSCLLFLPVLSRNSQAAENVSIKEWNLAFDRREGIAEELPFIVPVVIDEGIQSGAELIDTRFWKWDAKTFIGGVLTDDFLSSIEAKVKQHIRARNR